MMSECVVHVQARVWSCNSKYVLFPVFISLLSLFVYSWGGGCWSVGGSRSHCMIFKVQASLAFFDGKPFPLNQVHCLLLFIYV